MPLRLIHLVAAIVAVCSVSVRAQTKIRVMPLGDSITEARHGDASYRYFLWHELKNKGYDLDFVGTMTGVQGLNGVGHNGTPKFTNFDQNHEGHWGWRADEIADNIINWALAAQPDIVLLHIGTNDLFQNQTVASTIGDIGRIIDRLRSVRPGVKIALAKIIPVGPRFPVDVRPLNAAIPGLVASKSTPQSPILVIDHYAGWNSQLHTYDDVHANEDGEKRLCTKWTPAIEQFLTRPTAAFAATPRSGAAPLRVNFTENATGLPSSWLWTFGDGNTSSARSPSHVYASAGSFRVTLRVTNSNGTNSLSRAGYITTTSGGSSNPNAIRVMPLGDSITASSNGFASYRYFLWQQLQSNGYCVDFVGSKSGVRSGAPKYSNFDQNYEGGWGLRADQLAANAFAWAGSAQPHAVLCHAGIDDVYQRQSVASTILDLGKIIDELRRANPNVIILLAQLNPFAAKFGLDVRPYNAAMPALVASKTTTQSPIILVDHFSGWDTAIHTHNGIHSSELGEQRMAATWYAELSKVIPDCNGNGGLNSPVTPDAVFVGTPTTGVTPHPVTFTDQSTNQPTSWFWSFGDGTTSTAQNPSHTYATAGSFTVALTANNSAGSDTMVRTEYLVVSAPSTGGGGPTGGSQPKLKIMPLGDSITASSKGFASYRYFLWHQLIASGHCVDFVGSQSGVRSGQPKYADFDQDFEGGWGLRADQLAANAYQWTAAAMPDVVLVHAGIDDVYQGQSVSSTIADLGRIIDEIRRANPSATIFLAQLNPFGPRFARDVVPLNNAIPALVASKTTPQSPVVLVDHFTGWNTSVHTFNDIHSNEAGEQRMANTWHSALVAQSVPTCSSGGGGGSGPTTLAIMPLGDSITASSKGFASYRYFLWHQLANSGHCAEFVGSRSGVRSGQPKYSDFDQDYEGGWGLRADQLAANAYDWAVANPPDIVLLHAGIDDVYQNQSVSSTIADLGRIIDELRRAKPDVKILLAQLNPFGPRFPRDVRPLNSAMPDLVATKNSAASPVVLVDHYTGWNTAIHTFNDIHSNELGETRMANTWHDAILDLDLKCVASLSNTGGGCAGRNGTPSLSSLDGAAPVPGESIQLRLGGLPPGAPVFAVLGFGDTSYDGMKLPLELSAIGMPNCWLAVSPDVLFTLTADQARSASWTLEVPDFLHQKFFVQAFVSDPGSNALGMTATNARAGTVR